MFAGFRSLAAGLALAVMALAAAWSQWPATARDNSDPKGRFIRTIDTTDFPVSPPSRNTPVSSGGTSILTDIPLQDPNTNVATPGAAALSPGWLQLLAIAEDGPIAFDEWHSIGGSAESFRRFDSDGDGRITFDEVEAAISKSPGAALNRSVFAQPNPHRIRSVSNTPGRRTRNSRFVGIAAAPAPVVASASLAPAATAPSAPSPPPAPSPSAPANPSSAKPMSLADDAAATTALPLDDGSNPYWAARNQQNLDRIADGERARVLFLGDSGTDLFSIGLGRPLWEKYFVPLGSVNFAVGGATTSQVLWQIETGQVERMEPQVVVVLIGSNNLAVGQSPAAVARGITKVVNELQLRMPQSRVLLLGLMPRQAAATDPIRAKLAEVNRLIAGLDDGISLRFVDFSNRMIERDGSLSPLVMPDFLHPSLLGYQIYATSIWPTLLSMLN